MRLAQGCSTFSPIRLPGRSLVALDASSGCSLLEEKPGLICVDRCGRNAGYVRLVWQPTDLHVADLCIREGLRGRGLGTALLRAVRELARARRIQTLLGSVVHRDLAERPGLLDWYRRQAFHVTGVDHTLEAAHLRLDLRPSPPYWQGQATEAE